MNIYIISPNVIWGGAATANMAIAEMLSKNHTVYYNDEYNKVNIKGVEYDAFPTHQLKNSSRLESHLINKRIDVVIWGIAMNIPYYYKAIKSLKKRNIINCVLFHSLSIVKNIKGLIMDRLISMSLKYVDHLIFVSKYTEISWSKYSMVRKHPNHHVIYNPIAIGESYKRTRNTNIGFVGRFSPEKQPEKFAELSEIDCNNKYIAWGDGPLLNDIKDKYCKVEFKGQSSNQDVIYKSFDILVMTSLFENCPMVILEAWKNGIPCVVPAVGGIPEMVNDFNSGRIYKEFSKNAILECINDIQKNYSIYSSNALLAVQKFSYDRIYKLWDNVLN